MLNDDRQTKDSPLSVIDASGRQISLLNDNAGQVEPDSPQSYSSDEATWLGSATYNHPTLLNQYQQTTLASTSFDNKRKYHCSEPGCKKSFTTSGHLARHHRIHTGEKNFPCLFPGCQSRFSRQDNMMQHYRTHMSPKSRRTTKRPLEDTHPRPRLHAHHRIRSDPYQLDPPLTIDQHLSNYHRSLAPPSSSKQPALLHLQQQQQQSSIPLRSNSSSSTAMDTTTTSSSSLSSHLFYQHRPLVYPNNSNNLDELTNHGAGHHHQHSSSSSTLLHPPPSTSSINNLSDSIPTPEPSKKDEKDPKQDSLLQLAHIVSTFG
ncbi:hypothetical protein BC941DRAFT_369010 [Chlamydoabsidia padenii]|nr:hypothetical protein BC941DRAFT_369010 [Chlamydoabsidia padenii]